MDMDARKQSLIDASTLGFIAGVVGSQKRYPGLQTAEQALASIEAELQRRAQALGRKE
jgi:hypothetical protein